jgi:hypothetical protein
MYLEHQPNNREEYGEDSKPFHVVPDSVIFLVGHPCFWYEDKEEHVQGNQYDSYVEHLL